MKMLVSRTPISTSDPFDLDAVKLHLRVDDPDEDQSIANMAHTAALEVEQFAQIALLNQTVRVVVFDPTLTLDWRLPIGPVADDAAISVTLDGAAFTDFTLVGGNRAMVRLGETYANALPDRITIQYVAGFGDAAADIPPDLAQAIMDQAALLYDGRSPFDGKALTTSPHMARVGARYRGVKV